MPGQHAIIDAQDASGLPLRAAPLTRAERLALGKQLRQTVPVADLARWSASDRRRPGRAGHREPHRRVSGRRPGGADGGVPVRVPARIGGGDGVRLAQLPSTGSVR